MDDTFVGFSQENVLDEITCGQNDQVWLALVEIGIHASRTLCCWDNGYLSHSMDVNVALLCDVEHSGLIRVKIPLIGRNLYP